MRSVFKFFLGWMFYFLSRNNSLKESRLAVCVDCDNIGYDFDFFCKKCDCTLNYKASLKSEVCPLNKWELINEQSKKKTKD